MARALTSIALDGAVTIASDIMKEAKAIEVLCTNVSGTSDGTMAVYGSIDGTNYQLLNFVGQALGTASPVASLTGADLNQITITDTLVASWVIDTDVYKYTKLVCVGTTGDNTTITGFWSK